MQIGTNIGSLPGLTGVLPGGLTGDGNNAAEAGQWNAVLGEVLASIAGPAGLQVQGQAGVAPVPELSGSTTVSASSELDGLLRKLLQQLEPLMQLSQAAGQSESDPSKVSGLQLARTEQGLSLKCGPLQVDYDGQTISLDFDLPRADAAGLADAEAVKNTASAERLRRLPSPEAQLMAALAALLRTLEQQVDNSAPLEEHAAASAAAVQAAIPKSSAAGEAAVAEQAKSLEPALTIGTAVVNAQPGSESSKGSQAEAQLSASGKAKAQPAVSEDTATASSTAIKAQPQPAAGEGPKAQGVAHADAAAQTDMARQSGTPVTQAQPLRPAEPAIVQAGPIKVQPAAGGAPEAADGAAADMRAAQELLSGQPLQHINLSFKLAGGRQQQLMLKLADAVSAAAEPSGALRATVPGDAHRLELLQLPVQRLLPRTTEVAAGLTNTNALRGSVVELSLLPHFTAEAGSPVQPRAELRRLPQLQLLDAATTTAGSPETLSLLPQVEELPSMLPRLDLQSTEARALAAAEPADPAESARQLELAAAVETAAALKETGQQAAAAEETAQQDEQLDEQAADALELAEAQAAEPGRQQQADAAGVRPLERDALGRLRPADSSLPRSARPLAAPSEEQIRAAGREALELPLQLAQFSRPEALAQPAPRGLISAATLQRLGDLARQAQRAGDGDYQATLRLDPPSLGRVEVSIVVQGNAVALQFSSSNSQARRELRESIAGLKASLTEAGLSVADIDVVELDPHTGSADSEGGQAESQAQRDSAAAEHALWESHGAAHAEAAQQFEWRGLLAAQLKR